MLEVLRQDLRFTMRALRRDHALAAIVVLVLAFGIGANTAIFTFVNAALLKPLPYPQADRIVALQQRPPKGQATTPVHPRSFIEWRARAQSFEALAIAQAIPVNTQGVEGAEQVAGLWASSEIFRIFGVQPLMGRLFTDKEGFDRAAIRGQTADFGGSVVILSHGYWQRRFASDPAILGKTIPLGRGSSTVVGILPAGFRIGTLDTDLYLPLPLDPSKPDGVGSRGFQCYGLLRPGVAIDAARAEMAVLADSVSRQTRWDEGWSVVVLTLRDYLVRDNRVVLLVLLGVVACVLLIACANVAALLLTRSIDRGSELALRVALGATRGRLIRQLMVESLALSVMGGALGLLLGVWSSRVLIFLANDAVAFGQMADVRLDVRVLAFNVALSLITSIVFGLAPAWQASRFNLQPALKRGANRTQQRFRAALVVGEVALAVVLLVGAGLLLRTFSHLLQVKLGFQPEQALTLRMLVTGDPFRRATLVENILDRVETLPEVRAAGTIQFLPMTGFTNNGPFHFVGRPKPADPMSMESDVSTVSRGYFAAMGIPVLRGRPFGRLDHMESPRVALVNQAFVNRYCPNEDPIGQVILGDWANPKPTEIIGVTGDIRQIGLNVEPRPTVFLAQSQVPGYITYIVVRTAAEPMKLAAAIRREIQQVDPRQPVTQVQTMEQYVSAALSRPRLYAVLLGTFAFLAIALAAVGLYGLMAYVVGRRTHEIGIRMALGAQPREVLRSTLSQGARLTLAGLVFGIVAAIVLSRSVSNLLYGVSPSDLTTYVAVPLLLGAVALLATFIPALRASRVDPMVALRYE